MSRCVLHQEACSKLRLGWIWRLPAPFSAFSQTTGAFFGRSRILYSVHLSQALRSLPHVSLFACSIFTACVIRRIEPFRSCRTLAMNDMWQPNLFNGLFVLRHSSSLSSRPSRSPSHSFDSDVLAHSLHKAN